MLRRKCVARRAVVEMLGGARVHVPGPVVMSNVEVRTWMSAAVSAITVGSVRVHAVSAGYVLDLGSAGDASGSHRVSLHMYPATVMCGPLG